MQSLKIAIKKIAPRGVLSFYHFLLAFIAGLWYGFPSRRLIVVGITGTKGKTSTAEVLTNIFEAAGRKTALLGTLKFKIGEKSERNLRKMTMPGRFFVQKFLSDAVAAGCTHAVIEMTSEGAKQFRQRFIDMDALIFTNLAPEHIESHGSYEAYRDAKLAIATTLARSTKRRRLMIANADDAEGEKFLSVANITPLPYRLSDVSNLVADDEHIAFIFRGADLHSALAGVFNAYNVLAAATCAAEMGVPPNVIAAGVARTEKIEGRMEKIEGGQPFSVIVDYAHTPDSLEAVYKTFPKNELVCVLGNTGGGRDRWKRPVMGALADTYCKNIILTNEDPYDEDPESILKEIALGIKGKQPEIIPDRRTAIARAFTLAKECSEPVVLLTGKGTDPFIMGPGGTKEKWDDRAVAREELQKMFG